MAQRKQLTWTELRVGIFVLVGLLVAVVAIFYVTGGGLFGAKYRLITYAAEVDELQTGAPVTLDGIEVGNVEALKLTPHPQDKVHNITIVMRVDKKFQDQIRTDSQAALITQGLLGNRYVSISRGLKGTPIPSNGAIPVSQQPDMKAIIQRGSDVMASLGTLSTTINQVVAKINSGQGTVGKVINDPSMYDRLNASVGKIDAMIASI